MKVNMLKKSHFELATWKYTFRNSHNFLFHKLEQASYLLVQLNLFTAMMYMVLKHHLPTWVEGSCLLPMPRSILTFCAMLILSHHTLSAPESSILMILNVVWQAFFFAHPLFDKDIYSCSCKIPTRSILVIYSVHTLSDLCQVSLIQFF